MKNNLKTDNKNRIIKNSLKLSLLSLALILAGLQSIKAQTTYTNSYSRMLDITSTLNQNLYNQQNNYNQMLNRTKAAVQGQSNGNYSTGSEAPAAQPPLPQYPITATDFAPSQGRILPSQIANSLSDVSAEERENLLNAYYLCLTQYEKQFRKNNIAGAYAYIVAMSLEVVNGKPLSRNDLILMISYYNNALGNSADFLTMSPRQKQVIYESIVLTASTIGVLHQQNNTAMQSQSTEMAKTVLRNFVGLKIQ